MNKYTFIILPTIFNGPSYVEYDVVHHKRLDEGIEKIRIIIISTDIKESLEKAKKELAQLIAYNFGDIPNIDYYAFRLRLIEIQNQ